MPPKRRKGVTFKLVHQSYDDETGDGAPRAIMVEEREVLKHLPSAAAPHRRQRNQRAEDDAYESTTISDWAQEWDSCGTTTRAGAVAVTASSSSSSSSFSVKAGVVQLPGEDAYMNKRNLLRAQDSDSDHRDDDDDDDDDKLFEDQEEVEFTDDFLRELVFGGELEGSKQQHNSAAAAAAASNHDGNECDPTAGSSPMDNRVYAQHDVTKRGVDRQFTKMMREFNVDAGLNDAYTDDPRAHGALEVNQYLRALEEFAVDRAGVDYDTAEPLRNKGFIQQLRSMALYAGADMSPTGEVHTTTVLPDKQTRLVAEYQQETEAIREAARQRMLERQRKRHIAEEFADEEEVEENLTEEEEVYVVKEVVDKANRLDCETAVSAYSTYFNQPNVIMAPEKGKRRKGRKMHASSQGGGNDDDDDDDNQNNNNNGNDSSGEDDMPRMDAALLTFTRTKGETKEEKKLRQRLVKQAQRERRGKKQELKQAYKILETDEARRSKESQAAKKTVHFF